MGIFLDIHQFACLNDNYGYLVHEPGSGETAAIDTPDAERYLAEADKRGWSITQVWNTHWHPDHAGGNLRLKEATGCRILGPSGEAAKIPGLDQPLKGGDVAVLGEAVASVIDVPGHTLGQGRTVICIAHRLSTLANMDEIIVLDHGRIVERGTFEKLLKAKGHFAKMAEQQRLTASS